VIINMYYFCKLIRLLKEKKKKKSGNRLIPGTLYQPRTCIHACGFGIYRMTGFVIMGTMPGFLRAAVNILILLPWLRCMGEIKRLNPHRVHITLARPVEIDR
jgi:hypothetical protein